MLTREEIIAAQRARRKTVDVPAWGGQVLVKPISATEFLSIRRDLGDSPDDTSRVQYVQRIAAASVVDAEDNLIFTGEEGEKLLRELDHSTLLLFVKASLGEDAKKNEG